LVTVGVSGGVATPNLILGGNSVEAIITGTKESVWRRRAAAQRAFKPLAVRHAI
jgi:hypothetical protein